MKLLKYAPQFFDSPPSTKVKVTQSCLTLCNPTECSPAGCSVHGILQARTVEWVAITLSRGIFPSQGSNLGLWECRQILYHLSHQGSPRVETKYLPQGCELNAVSYFFGYNVTKVIVCEGHNRNQGFLQRKHTDGQQAHAKMFHITNP